MPYLPLTLKKLYNPI